MAWDTCNFTKIRTYRGHENNVNSIDVLGDRVVTGSDDCTVKIWDNRSQKYSSSFKLGYQVTSVAQVDQAIFFAGVDNTIRSINLRTNTLELLLVGHADIVTSIALPKQPNGYLLSNAMDGAVMVWDVKPFSELETRMVRCYVGATHNFEKNLLKCCWSSDNSLISAGSADRTVNVWDVKSGDMKHRLGGHKGSVNETSINGNLIASCSSDKTIIVGKIEN